MTSGSIRLLLVAALMAATTVGLAPTAAAATRVLHTSAQLTEYQAFAQWGDDRYFQPLPGGTDATALQIEPSVLAPVGWRWFRDAGFRTGGTPWDIWRTTQKTVLSLDRRGSAAVLRSYSDYVEDIRFFYHAPRAGAILDLKVYALDLKGLSIDYLLHRIEAPRAGWNVSPAMTVDSIGRSGFWLIELVFFSVDEGGFLVDDISIDPWRSRTP